MLPANPIQCLYCGGLRGYHVKWCRRNAAMKSSLEDLKARVIIMQDYLKAEEDIQIDSQYAEDLRTSIKRCKKDIKQLTYARDNPIVFVS